jgi:hypothetical protein
MNDISSIRVDRTPQKPLFPTTLVSRKRVNVPRKPAPSAPFVPEVIDSSRPKTNVTADSRLAVSISRLAGAHNNTFLYDKSSFPKRYLLDLSTTDENPQKNCTLYEDQDPNDFEDLRETDDSDAQSFLEISNRFFPKLNESLSTDQLSILIEKQNGERICLPPKRLTFHSLKLKHSVTVCGSVGSILEFKGPALKVLRSVEPKRIEFSEVNFRVDKRSNFVELSDKFTDFCLRNCFLKGSAHQPETPGSGAPKINALSNLKAEPDPIDNVPSNLDTRRSELIKSRSMNNFKPTDGKSVVFDLWNVPALATLTVTIESSILQGFGSLLRLPHDREVKTIQLNFFRCNFSYFETFLEVLSSLEVENIFLEFKECKANNVGCFVSLQPHARTRVVLKLTNCEFSNVKRGVAVFDLSPSSQVTVKNCSFLMCDIPIAVLSSRCPVSVVGCTFARNTGCQVYLGDLFLPFSIENCTFINNTGGFGCHVAGSFGRIDGCSLTGGQGVLVSGNLGGNELVVENCQFTECNGPALLLDKTTARGSIGIRKNRFSGEKELIVVEDFPQTEVHIQNNLIHSTGHALVVSNRASPVLIKDNRFDPWKKPPTEPKTNPEGSLGSFFAKSFDSLSGLFGKHTQVKTPRQKIQNG